MLTSELFSNNFVLKKCIIKQKSGKYISIFVNFIYKYTRKDTFMLTNGISIYIISICS